MSEAESLARACAEAASDRKAQDIVVLDLSGVSTFTDFFVICSADSDPQIKAVASSIRESLREKFSRKPLSEDGFPASQWVVLDYGEVIIHVFHSEKREHYDLEKLWSDARRVELDPSEP